MLRAKKHGGSFGFKCVVANICGGDVAWVAWVKCKNPGALPTFPAWEGVTTHSPLLPDLLEDDSLFVVRCQNGHTGIDPLSHWGPLAEWGRLARERGIRQALSDEHEATSVSERILRGDFDA